MTPRHDLSDAATKADLAELRADMKEWRDTMKADMKEWRNAMRADIAGVKSETRAINRRMDGLLHTLLAGLFVVVAASVGVIIAVL